MSRSMLTIKKLITLAVCLAFVLVTVSGCSTYASFAEEFLSEEKEEDVVRIGVFEPLSGSDEEAARFEIMGIELAHKLHPTVLGKRVELVYADNKSEITVAESAAQMLVEKEVDVVLVMPTSKPALARASAKASGALKEGYPVGVPPAKVVSTLQRARSAASIYFFTY
jgi:hypothetical protein